MLTVMQVIYTLNLSLYFTPYDTWSFFIQPDDSKGKYSSIPYSSGRQIEVYSLHIGPSKYGYGECYGYVNYNGTYGYVYLFKP